jgi:Na+/H+ antiporter NhaC
MPEPASFAPGALSLLPALVTIALAFATRQVILALAAGIAAGGAVLFAHSGTLADLNVIERFLLPAVGSRSYAGVLLIYLWCLGGLVGLWDRTGGARHFAETGGARLARGPRSALVFGWLVGLLFHQGGTVSTVLAGTTVKPVTDRHRVSHEELAYVVDSTASPVATLLPFNAWPAYVAGLVVATVPVIPDEASGLAFFVSSLPFNFYAVLAVLSTGLFALGALPWVGRRMGRARSRARETGRLDAPDAQPLLGDVSAPRASGYRPSLLDFTVPVGVLLAVAIVPYALTGRYLINEAFLAALLSAMVVARLRGMSLADVLDAFVAGCRAMTLGAIVLGLAVTLGEVSRELHAADFLIRTVGASVPPVLLPALLGALCMLIAFATGTSWGTYAVVFPVALPLAWAVQADPDYLRVCFGAVLGGAVFGDQCSPISDTTILSSMFTGCDLMDHVRTQIPLALGAAGVAALCSTLAALSV